MDNQNQTESKNRLCVVFRWLLFLPAAFLIANVVNLFLGLLVTFWDSVSAFVFSFVFVFSAGWLVPAQNTKVAIVLFLIITLLVILSFIPIPGVVGFSESLRPGQLAITVSHILGALYAMFLIPAFTIRGATVERLWKQTTVLGTILMLFGGILSIVGFIIIITCQTRQELTNLLLQLEGFIIIITCQPWVTFFTGIIVLGIGIITKLFPYVHLFLRAQKAKKNAPHLIQELKEQSPKDG